MTLDGKFVLVVEDDNITLGLWGRRLRSQGRRERWGASMPRSTSSQRQSSPRFTRIA